MKWLACLGVFAATAILTDAKVELKTADGRKTRVEAPKLKLGTDDDLCLFKDRDDSWCLTAEAPMVEVGWEWEQSFTTTPSSDAPVVEYYQVSLQPFIEIQANFDSRLEIHNIWVNNLTASLDKFKTNLFISLIFNENFQVCPGVGWETQNVLFRFLYSMNFWNCAKVLVDDLSDFSTTYTGVNAKYFETCSKSDDAQIILYEKVFFEAQEDQIILGTVDPKSATFCFIGSTSSASPNFAENTLVRMAYKTFFTWAVENYPESFV